MACELSGPVSRERCDNGVVHRHTLPERQALNVYYTFIINGGDKVLVNVTAETVKLSEAAQFDKLCSRADVNSSTSCAHELM